MDVFWSGFEKRSYDYGHESKMLDAWHHLRADQEPISKTKVGLWGAGLGGGIGAIAGALKGKSSRFGVLAHGLMGGAAGAGLGGLAGVITAMADKLGIEEAKRIVAMPKDDRKDYLAHLARQSEISAQQHRDWRNALLSESQDDRRHRELLGALKSEKRAEERNRVDDIAALGGALSGTLLASHMADMGKIKLSPKLKMPVMALAGIGGGTVAGGTSKALRTLFSFKKKDTYPTIRHEHEFLGGV